MRACGRRCELRGWVAGLLWLKPANWKPVETGWSGNRVDVGMCGPLDHR